MTFHRQSAVLYHRASYKADIPHRSVKYAAVIAAFDIDNVAVHNIDIAVAYFYPDIVLHIMLKHSVKNAFYSFGAEGLQNIRLP